MEGSSNEKRFFAGEARSSTRRKNQGRRSTWFWEQLALSFNERLSRERFHDSQRIPGGSNPSVIFFVRPLSASEKFNSQKITHFFASRSRNHGCVPGSSTRSSVVDRKKQHEGASACARLFVKPSKTLDSFSSIYVEEETRNAEVLPFLSAASMLLVEIEGVISECCYQFRSFLDVDFCAT